MSAYTPDLSDAQSYYVAGRAQLRRQITGEQAIDVTEYSHEFDRMISEVRAEAWAEGYAAGQDSIYTATDEWPNPACVNPYRAALGLTAGQEGKNDEHS